MIMSPEPIEEKTEQKTITIPLDYKQTRLDAALAKLLPEFSRTEIKTWIEEGLIHLHDKPVKAKTKLKGGEIITLTIPPKPKPVWQAQEIPLDVVYEDDDVLVINKPAGLVVHPGSGNQDHTLLNALLHHAAELYDLPRAGIIHRIDKNTSGLLVIAKNKLALKALSQQLKHHTIIREYQAIVYGKLISGGTVDAPIGRHPLERKRMAVVETGKSAITHYRIVTKYPAHTHLLIRLETGRTHQIRVHMSHIRHPLVGDAIYGGRVKLSKGMTPELIQTLRQFKRQALHASALTFTHPTSGKIVRFEVDLPKDMQHLIEALKS